MGRVLCIVSAGSPGNHTLNYGCVVEGVEQLAYRRDDTEVIIVGNLAEALERLYAHETNRKHAELPPKTMFVVFVSMYHYMEACGLAGHHPKIKFVIFSIEAHATQPVGASAGAPKCVFRGQLTPETFDQVFATELN